MRRLALVALVGLLPAPALGRDDVLTLVLRCKNDDATAEVYLPQSIVTGRTPANIDLAKPARGFYVLDLTDARKGKTLEPARVSLRADKKAVIVEQLTRRLPAATVPVAGGTVSFDHRFAENMVCEPFNGE
jgi:hypothetical protein